MNIRKKQIAREINVIIKDKTDYKTNEHDILLIINTFIEVIKNKLKAGFSLEFRGLGKLKRRIIKKKKGRNPKTGEIFDVIRKNTIKFKISKVFKDELN
jgi:nucleoid DNA-binding protein